MNNKTCLVEYRRTSSDMDMSSSDGESNAEQPSSHLQQPTKNHPSNDIANSGKGQCKVLEPSATVVKSRESKICDKSRNSHSTREERLQEWEKQRELKLRDERRENGKKEQRSKEHEEQKLRDERRENGKKEPRSKEHGRDRKDKKGKEHSESKHEDKPTSPDRRKRRSPERSRARSPHRDSSQHRHRSRSGGRKKHSPDHRRHSSERKEKKRSHSPVHNVRKFRRTSRSPETFRSKRLERKAARIDKLGLELFAEAKPGVMPNAFGDSRTSFYNAGAMNPAARLTEQIQKRRLLWGAKKEAAPVKEPAVDAAGTSQAWEAATFKGDNDGKMTEKFKRLMGIKGDGTPSGPVPGGSTIIQKQEEMFSNMEAQYQVARMATHTHRGIGLGFGTFQVPPR